MSKFLKINRFFAILVLAVLFISCSDNNNSNDGPGFNEEELSEEEIAILKERINDVTNDVESYVAKVSSIEELEKYIDEISENPNIDSAWIENGALGVKVKDGGLIIYDEGMPYDDSQSRTSQTLPTENLQAIKSRLAEVSRKNISQINNIQDNTLSRSAEKFLHGCKNKKVLLFNTEKFAESDIKELETLLNSLYGVFEVTVKQGEECTADFILNNFQDYGLILMVAHGNYLDGKHWIVTGTPVKKTEWYNQTIETWKKGFGCIYRERFGEGNSYWAINEDEIGSNMHLEEFEENSILYAATCHTFNSNKNLVNAFRILGLGAFIGFDKAVEYKCAICGFYEILFDMIFSRSAIDFSEEGIEHKEISLMESYNDNKNIFSDWSGTHGYNTQMCISCESDDLAVFSTINSEEVVNLGLKANWAGCNIDAKSPEEHGKYYQICDGIDFAAELKKFFGNSYDSYTKYIFGLYEQDDKANKLLGGEWHLPDTIDLHDLADKTIKVCYEYNNIKGLRVISITGESIFLPASGWKYNNEHKPSENEHIGLNVAAGYPCKYGTYTEYRFNTDEINIKCFWFNVDEKVYKIGNYRESYRFVNKYNSLDYRVYWERPIRAVQDNPFYNNQQSKSTQNSMIQCAKISN